MSERSQRLKRIDNRLMRELCLLLQQEVSDPRLQSISVTEVRVSKDLSHAKVFVSIEAGAEKKTVFNALTRAAGFFRSELADRVELRIMPKLQFEEDISIHEGHRLSALIDQAMSSSLPSKQDDDDAHA